VASIARAASQQAAARWSSPLLLSDLPSLLRHGGPLSFGAGFTDASAQESGARIGRKTCRIVDALTERRR